jgi:signal transduction histidine kinase/ActR/RegA family two-component response regulator
MAFFSAKLAGETASYEIEFRLRHKDGHYVPVLSRGYVLRNADGKAIRASGMNTDLTERKRIDGARQQALDLLQKIADRVPGVVYQFRMRPDGSSCFPYASDAIRHIYRVAPEDVMHDASPIFAVLHPDDYAAVAGSIEESRQSLRPWRQEYRVKFNDGAVQWLLGNAVPELEDDGSVLWHGFITEISAQKEAERERESLEEQLRESQKMEAIGTLAGGIAHDFNNIIGTILGNTELTRQDVDGNPRALESLDEIRKAGQRARDLVRQILSYSRRQPTTRRVLALKPVIDEVLRLLKSTLMAPISIDCVYASTVPEIFADAIQVEQVLINLITNAAQAMHGKPGRIDIDVDSTNLTELGKVSPINLQPGAYVRITVRDSGHGMDAVTLEHIFEPFFTTKPVGAGTGLGLSVVYGIMQAHNGAVVAHSEPGKGSSFVLYFPTAQATAPPQATAASDSPKSNAKVRGCRVLYLDDEESLTLLVKRLLGRRGHSVTCFVDPREALATLRADSKAFDLVVTDYNMPAMNGIDFAIAARQIRPELPIAIASGFITDDIKARASAIGIRDLIFKPNAVEEYCETVDRLTRAAHGPAGEGG